MSIVADFSVPPEAYCLAGTLHTLPDASVELDRLVAHSPNYVMPFVWVLDTDHERFEAALAEDPTVDAATVTDSFEDAHLFQVTWADVVSERLDVILDHEGVILDARGTRDEWRFWVRFGSRDQFGEFAEHFRSFGEVTLHQMRPPQTPGGITYGVSEKQREALLAAYDVGYYDVPSSGSGEELARQFDVSQQAISNRLRRGVRTLIEHTLDRHRDG